MRLMLGSLLLVLLSIHAGASENVVKNGNLSVTEGKIADWLLQPKGLQLKNDSAGLPDGVVNSVQITVIGVQKHDGQLVQRIYPKESKTYRISGFMKGERPRAAYLQVKLYKKRKELSRITVGYSSKAWGKYSKLVNGQGADKIEVICRWRHYEKYQNGKVWFAQIKLEAVEKSVVFVGDSTVQDYACDSNKRGWGQMLAPMFNDSVAATNHAAGGRSTKTFRSEKRWEKVLQAKPNVVLIQFGHNDSHAKDRPEATDADTDFREYLRKYVKEARAAGIFPILVTPPHRRVFRKGKPGTALVSYANATKVVAEELAVPCIDLYGFTDNEMSKLGDKGSLPYFCSQKDRSHFSPKGAQWLASYVAMELKKIEQTRDLLK